MGGDKELIKLTASALSIEERAVLSVVELSSDGATVPFIARYRKDRTGGLDEVAIRDIIAKFEYFSELNKRKAYILRSISSQKKLTPGLQKLIEETWDRVRLEDIYLPYKKKRKTRGAQAIEQGLLPLSETVLNQEITRGDPNLEVSRYISEEKGLKNLSDVYQGVIYILGEKIADNHELRQQIREIFFTEGVIGSSKSPKYDGKPTKFDTYFEYSEKVSELLKEKGAHRYLAVTRGENEGALSVGVEVPDDRIVDLIRKETVRNEASIFNNILEEACRDAFFRLMKPSLTGEVRSAIKTFADGFSIRVFAKNLKTILLTSPFGTRKVLAIDPGFRTGCKVATLSDTGDFLENATIFPNEPHNNKENSEEILLSLMKKHSPDAIVIGNGTASRETHSFIRDFLSRNKDLKVITVVVSESGASVYSASSLAREEFPNLDVTVRSSVSIGRRFQDPLSELVKLDPKSVGVGQYQHDVNQSKLKKGLEDVVADCVNFVGVEVNTASKELLSYISGVGPALAHNIVEFRKNERFKAREELKEVSRFSEKVFEQAAGFLRISGGENRLDNTGIHPESYPVVEVIAKKTGKKISDFIGDVSVLKALRIEDFVTQDFGPLTVKDIIEELKKPGRDPRRKFEVISFADGVHEIKDLKQGMILNGVVTNVTNFGAFVDVGVHTDGLVHTSEIANRFVTDPSEVVSVGDHVRVSVLGVDLDKKQISFSIRAALAREARSVPVKEHSRPKEVKDRERGRGDIAGKEKAPVRKPQASRREDFERRGRKGSEKKKALSDKPFAALGKLIK